MNDAPDPILQCDLQPALLIHILQELGDAVIVKDDQRRFVFFNRNLLLSSRLTPEEVLGKRDENFLPPEQAESAKSQDHEVLKTGRVFKYDRTIEFDDRSVVFQFTKSRVIDPDTQKHYIVVVAKDVTDLRRMQDQVQTNQKIQALSQMSMGLSRELSNTLVGILGNVQIARSRLARGEDPKRCLDGIEWAGQAANDLVRQFLLFGSTRATANADNGSIGDLLNYTLRFALDETVIRHKMTLPDDLWPCRMDKADISQAIYNLARNAALRMREGETISVFCRNMDGNTCLSGSLAPGPYVRISFADTGASIPQDQAAQIFDPFFHWNGVDCGMLLSVANRIAQRNGGLLEYDTNYDQGCLFHLYLPAVTEPLPPTRSPQSVLPDRVCRVLQIIANPIARKAVTEMVRELGHESFSSATLDDALAREDNTADMVLLDLDACPSPKEGMTRLHQAYPQARILLAAAPSALPDDEQWKQAGYAGCIVKPFSLDSLQHALFCDCQSE